MLGDKSAATHAQSLLIYLFIAKHGSQNQYALPVLHFMLPLYNNTIHGAVGIWINKIKYQGDHFRVSLLILSALPQSVFAKRENNMHRKSCLLQPYILHNYFHFFEVWGIVTCTKINSGLVCRHNGGHIHVDAEYTLGRDQFNSVWLAV